MASSELKEQVESAILEFEHQRARGKLCNGNWHYLRATPDESEPTGWVITSGEEISPCYSEREYFGRPGAPVTFWTCQESDFAGAYYSGCVWEEASWEEGDYAHLSDDYENHIGLSAGFQHALIQAMDEGLIEESDLPDTEEEAKTVLVGAGFIPFVLGEWTDPADLDEVVENAIKAIEAASSEENQCAAQ